MMGCGYTILRDLDAEARQAEFAGIDSLVTAPDLTISDIEYEYAPPRERSDPLDQWAYPPQGWFYVTVENIGNAALSKLYLLVFRSLKRLPYESNSFFGIMRNKEGDTLSVNGTDEIEIPFDYPYERTSYEFTLVTDSIIQHLVIEELKNSVWYPPVPPVVREFRYDNNDAEMTIPGYHDILREEQQQ